MRWKRGGTVTEDAKEHSRDSRNERRLWGED